MVISKSAFQEQLQIGTVQNDKIGHEMTMMKNKLVRNEQKGRNDVVKNELSNLMYHDMRTTNNTAVATFMTIVPRNLALWFPVR